MELYINDKDVFRHEHPDTRPGKEWWNIVKSKVNTKEPFKPDTIKCRICGNEFIPRTWRHKICSVSCVQINRIRLNKEHNDKKRNKIKGKCVICGTSFLKRNSQITCSKKCSDINNRIKKSEYEKQIRQARKKMRNK